MARTVRIALVGFISATGCLLPRGAHSAPHRSGKGGDIGLGLALGDPTGLSAKWFIRSPHALQAHLAFAPLHLGGGRADVSYLWHPPPFHRTEEIDIQGYVGAGVGIAFWSQRYIGPAPDRFSPAAFFFRAPVLGLAFHLHKLPLDIFIETAYSPLVGPPISYWNFDLAIGARYWF